MKFLGLFIFFIFLVSYFRKKNNRLQDEQDAQFWEREIQANNTRRQDISGLPYINIPLEQFPIGICKNADLNRYETTLSTLAAQRILNLAGQSNTDLKLTYGAANLDVLSQYDQNFTLLCRTLASYAECLIELGFSSEAQYVLEFGISCGSDLRKNFLLLADLYKEQGLTAELKDLRERAMNLNSMMKDSILQQLNQKIDS